MSKGWVFKLVLNIEVHQDGNYSNQLRVSETHEVTCDGFLEVCAVLAKFHDLAVALKPK